MSFDNFIARYPTIIKERGRGTYGVVVEAADSSGNVLALKFVSMMQHPDFIDEIMVHNAVTKLFVPRLAEKMNNLAVAQAPMPVVKLFDYGQILAEFTPGVPPFTSPEYKHLTKGARKLTESLAKVASPQQPFGVMVMSLADKTVYDYLFDLKGNAFRDATINVVKQFLLCLVILESFFDFTHWDISLQNLLVMRRPKVFRAQPEQYIRYVEANTGKKFTVPILNESMVVLSDFGFAQARIRGRDMQDIYIGGKGRYYGFSQEVIQQQGMNPIFDVHRFMCRLLIDADKLGRLKSMHPDVLKMVREVLYIDHKHQVLLENANRLIYKTVYQPLINDLDTMIKGSLIADILIRVVRNAKTLSVTPFLWTQEMAMLPLSLLEKAGSEFFGDMINNEYTLSRRDIEFVNISATNVLDVFG